MADQKIDVHAHFVTESYRQTLLDHGIDYPDGFPHIPTWSIQSHIDFMDSNGISKSIISISSPGTNFTSDTTLNRAVTRETNDHAASIKQQHPSRFGFFASLPISDITASVTEIGYALDTLNADGFVLMSNTNHIYLGDPILRPVLAELNARGAIVFVHPTSACNHHSDKSYKENYAISSPLATVYPAPHFEFFFDSARSILDLLNSSTVARFPRIRWIVSHCGGVLPSLLDRMFMMLRLASTIESHESYFAQEQLKALVTNPADEAQGKEQMNGRDPIAVTEEEVRTALREKFFFDLAGTPVPNQVEALLKFTTTGSLLFGSDVPFTPFEAAGVLVGEVEEGLPVAVGKEHVNAVYKDNAERMLLGGLPEE
ncbi:6-methylsalicylate decarboxylase, partial [Lecanoromycetidae sp. Uapishka_2]